MDESIERLVAALQAQTSAMNNLAESNRQLVDYLIAQEADEVDDERQPEQYLDGTPCR